MTGPTPLLDAFKRGEVPRDVKLQAAQGALAPRAHEQAAILVLLLDDADPEIRDAADQTLNRVPVERLKGFVARPDVPTAIREFFAGRGIVPDETAQAVDTDEPLIEAADAADVDEGDENEDRETALQRLAKMNFPQRLKAAVKGSREMRAILIRDPNKMIATAVLASPKLSEPEVEAFARMANVSEDVLRIIGSNRAWIKNYNVVLGLTKNPKTPIGMSLNLMSRLNLRDVTLLAVDRNVSEPLRIAARKKSASDKGG